MVADLKDAGPFFRRDPCAFLYQLAKSLPGKNVQITVAGEKLLIIQDFQDAEHVLSTRHENYLKNFSGLDYLLGQSRLTTDGDMWRRLQKLSQPAIARVPQNNVAHSTRRHYAYAADQILNLRQAGVLSTDIMPFIDLAAASVLFDQLLTAETKNFLNSLIEIFRATLTMGAKISWTMGREPNPLSESERHQYMSNRAEIEALVRHLIRKRDDNHAVSELVTCLTGAQTEIDIVGELNSLIFAGFDTTSTAVGWGIFLLSLDNNIKENLRSVTNGIDLETADGIDAVLQDKTMHAFFLETLRIFPPVPFLSRFADKKEQIRSIEIAEKQKILISVVGIHYNRFVYSYPGEVRLERWSDRDSEREHFIPFGMGRRRCGGALFGEREFKIAIATLIKLIDVHSELRSPLAFNWYGTLRRAGGQVMGISPYATEFV